MRALIIAAGLLLGGVIPAGAQVSIGIHLQFFPDFEPVPGYPVYYAPRLDSNLFFYDGLYWIYVDDYWYSSSWYDGPWDMVPPEFVPLFVLRVPVRYYRRPPPYFRGWVVDAPPRWDEHWGRDWAQHRRGWDRWDRAAIPPPAPLPTYQRQYSGDRYPRVDQQRTLRDQHYRYQPHEPLVRQQYQKPVQSAPAQRPREVERAPRNVPPETRRDNAPPAAETRRPQPERKATPQQGKHQQDKHQKDKPAIDRQPQPSKQGPPSRESQPAHSRDQEKPGRDQKPGKDRKHDGERDR